MWKFAGILLLFELFFKSACLESKVPVLMIDENFIMRRTTHKADPFAKTSSDYFSQLADDALKRADCILIFVEDKLCSEDLSTKDNLGTPYFHVRRSLANKHVVFFPSVPEPLEILYDTFEPRPFYIHHIGLGEKLHLLEEKKYLYIYFDDSTRMKRTERLRKHDAIIKDIYFTVRHLKRGPVVGFYTGRTNRISMAQMRSTPERYAERRDNKGIMVVTPDALFRLTGVFATTQTRRSAFDQTPTVVNETRTRDALSTTMRYIDIHLQFNFHLGASKWRLVNITLLEAGEEVGRTLTNIEAPWHHSFFCSEPIIINNKRDGSSITISEHQMEPLHASRRASGVSTFTAYVVNCGPFFNTPILCSMLVLFLFLSIAAWGVMMLMSCQTHDRFDDMNQKPLIIATEGGGGFS